MTKFPLWVGLALSVATVGPTLAMAGNGQELVAGVGKAVPLVFVIGLAAVALVGYSFVRLTRHLNHAGSAYALVGVTVGPRTGFVAGFAMLGAYAAFSIGTLAMTAAFANALLAELQRGAPHPDQLPWILPVLLAAAVSLMLTGRDARLLATVLLAIEGVGIAAMLVLSGVIVLRGGAPSTGVDLGTLSFAGVPAAAVLGGVVTAFLCWAGFEACASMGEETRDPRREIPRAIAGTLMLTGALFVIVMFAQTIGFGTDAAGLSAFAHSSNTLGDLGNAYLGEGFSVLIILTATVGAFGCHMATAAASGRMLFAFARDGLAPPSLAHLDPATGGPRRAVWLVVGVAVAVNIACAATGWPAGATGDRALDTYALFGIAGSVCLMLCYLLVEAAAVWFTLSPRFAAAHRGTWRLPAIVIPAAGVAVIAVVVVFSVKDADGWAAAPAFGLYWCATGVAIAIAASGRAHRVGQALTAEVEAAARP